MKCKVFCWREFGSDNFYEFTIHDKCLLFGNFFLLGRSAGVEAHLKKSHLNLPIKQISMGFWSFVCGCAWCEFTITIGSDFTLIFSILISQFLILWYQWTRIFFYDSDWSFRSTWDGFVTVWHYFRNFQPPARHQKFFRKK